MTAKEALLRLMNLPPSRFAGVVRTSDGFYIGREWNDVVGYNAFLGRPNAPHDGPGRELMLATWNALTPDEQEAVKILAANPEDGLPILLERDFGVPA